MSYSKRTLLSFCFFACSTVLATGCGSTDSKDDVKPETRKPRTEAPKLLTEDDLKLGWIALFDDESFFGWTPQNKADWKVEDKAINVSSGDAGLLTTNVGFADYVLRLEFRAAPETNSGIFLRTPEKPTNPAKDCYELNIAPDDNPFPTGSLVGRSKIDPKLAEKAKNAVGDDGWHSYEVKLEGPHVTVVWNQIEVLNYEAPEPLGRGRIGLQLNQGEVAFRKISLLPLGTTPIFNGKDLSGWKTYPEMESKFSVADNEELHVENGRGQLETEASYGDFVMQLQCKTNAADLNSGVFFRCIPGDVMMGYESQIHNGFKDGDRATPVDCGTGGIFRRVDARLVAADDLGWFFKTIVADGPRIAVWVNGYQVTDWEDTRKPDPNPRRGLRTEPGTIMIQGHDPTTDILFRHLRISETPKRTEPKTD